MNWVYRKTEAQLWTVGFYTPDGKFNSESDHSSPGEAAARVHWLNGGGPIIPPELAAEVSEVENRMRAEITESLRLLRRLLDGPL